MLPSSAASSPLELLQGFSGAGELFTPYLFFTAVFFAPLGSPEGLFTVSKYMLAMLGTLERGVLVTSDGLNYLGLELTNLGLSAIVMLCLYAQDPVAHYLSRRCAVFSLFVSALRSLTCPGSLSFGCYVGLFKGSALAIIWIGCERNTRANEDVV